MNSCPLFVLIKQIIPNYKRTRKYRSKGNRISRTIVYYIHYNDIILSSLLRYYNRDILPFATTPAAPVVYDVCIHMITI